MISDRLQEIFLVIGDRLAPISKKWWYALALVVIAWLPIYYVAKYAFVEARLSHYNVPRIVYVSATKEPLQIVDKKIFTLPNNTYSAYVRIRNINLEWGVAEQTYSAEFKTLGGTIVNKIQGQTFILPSSEKLIVFARFSSQEQIQDINFVLGDTHFIHKPDVSINLETERINLQNGAGGLIISGGVKNLTPFTLKQVDLPVLVYDSKNEIVAVSSTYMSDLLSSETRTFSTTWPLSVPTAIRAEIDPEVNIFDRDIFVPQAGVSPFENQ